MQRAIFALAILVLLVTALPAATRKWTSKDGKFSTVAELVEQDETSVTLKKKTGETITVPLEALGNSDRAYLRSLQKKAAAAKGNTTSQDPQAIVVSYVREVQPFLRCYCAECHNQASPKQGYDVTSYAALTRPGKNGPLVAPKKADNSRLFEVIYGISKSMPPSKKPQPVPQEIAKIRAWIEAGALDDSAGGVQPGGANSRTSGTRKPPRKNT